MRKAKVKLELNLQRDTKNSRKGFYKCVKQKRRVKGLLINNAGKLVTMDEKKAGVLNSFLPQSSMAMSLLTPFEWMDSRMGSEETKSLSLYVKIRFMTT